MTATEQALHPSRSAHADRVYRGIPARAHEGSQLVMIYDSGSLVGPLPHRIVRHSPTGFAWGYGGSGPSELALNLIVDALGDDAWCRECGGSGHSQGGVTTNPPEPAYCRHCGGDRVSAFAARRVYQTFKAHHVAVWPMDGGWEITRAEILNFVRGFGS